MRYFIAAYYQAGQSNWVNGSFFPALEMGAALLEPSWPGQACEVSEECAVPVSVAMPERLPCTLILENKGNGQFQEVARKCGEISASEIVQMLNDADKRAGGGGVNPFTDGQGVNPFGVLNIPMWAWAILALLLLNRK